MSSPGLPEGGTPHGPDAGRRVSIPTADGEMPGLFWEPFGGSDGSTGPGLVVFQEIFGLTAYIRSRCADLAALGYAVLAPEVYWRQGSPVLEGPGEETLPRALELRGQVDWEQTVGDGAAAWNLLRTLPSVTGGTGLIGFCFGGGVAYNVAAVTEPDVLVSYYGSDIPRLTDLAGRIGAPSLHHFGEADAYIGHEDQARIRDAVLAANPANSFLTYPGAGHAFDSTAAMFRHEEASDRAWVATTAFLAEHLPVST